MRFLPLILAHLRRNWIRSLLTVLAMAVCIFLICTLRTFVAAVDQNLKTSNASRLVTRHAVSLVFNVPVSYEERIASVPGVTKVAKVVWFGGARRVGDFSDFFPNLAVEADPYLDIYPEFVLTPDQRRAFLGDQRGCILGPDTAQRYGWKVGDTFSLESFIPPYRTGRPFDFVVSAIYSTDEARWPGTDRTLMLFHYNYLWEATGRRIGVGNYALEIDDPSRAGTISRTIDEMFDNSDAQTKTETEAAFRASFVALAGNLAFLLNSIGLAVSFTILLVTANTMAMAVRDRRTEIGVLKTLGFSSARVMGMILGEAALLGSAGGAIGLALSHVMIRALPHLPFIGNAVRGFRDLGLSPGVGAVGFGTALLIAFLAGIIPAVLAYRARITDLLRQT
jgi:putative ABC transport system permease protein